MSTDATTDRLAASLVDAAAEALAEAWTNATATAGEDETYTALDTREHASVAVVAALEWLCDEHVGPLGLRVQREHLSALARAMRELELKSRAGSAGSGLSGGTPR